MWLVQTVIYQKVQTRTIQDAPLLSSRIVNCVKFHKFFNLSMVPNSRAVRVMVRYSLNVTCAVEKLEYRQLSGGTSLFNNEWQHQQAQAEVGSGCGKDRHVETGDPFRILTSYFNGSSSSDPKPIHNQLCIWRGSQHSLLSDNKKPTTQDRPPHYPANVLALTSSFTSSLTTQPTVCIDYGTAAL